MTNTPDDRTPPELAALEAALRRAQFEPRASLAPEIAGRFAAGERPARSPRRFLPAAARVAAVLALLVLGAAVRAGYVPALDALAATTVTDSCCEDLDGVGGADDGIVVETVAGGTRIRSLMVYEEHDKDKTWTKGELVRFVRPSSTTLLAPSLGDSVVAHSYCCSDLDGGGLRDDGVLVLTGANGNVLMAALFDGAGFRTQNQLR